MMRLLALSLIAIVVLAIVGAGLWKNRKIEDQLSTVRDPEGLLRESDAYMYRMASARLVGEWVETEVEVATPTLSLRENGLAEIGRVKGTWALSPDQSEVLILLADKSDMTLKIVAPADAGPVRLVSDGASYARK